ncbi:succinyldiaminopimelate aminotransferase [Sediminihabitans luteus]|uniref:Succinyldiaminopimelate aminotransferase n=1 Tax=Sediminihabitans luteus TaxID=1138585 RepID=A0A2M9CYC3_9CELL|nr:aminotransferase class I/II-fold pyridoxal phosphate-dependent enzyme [Sediminihabitans luteus]PJJ76932.1 succinyldiaminopimelate aminotransferase [Sediminihabitans luteus]GII99573.1 aminotransferase [Sediminihabitans luteus]
MPDTTHPLHTAVPGRWRDAARATGLLRPDGSVAQTVFAEMTQLAARTGAINLGQGFPDVGGPASVRAAAVAAIEAGHNQYAPGPGIPELRHTIAAHQHRHYGLDVDPDTEVLVTTGATEALAATILALAGPGDEVVTLEPFYDAHAACIALAGATHVRVPMLPAPALPDHATSGTGSAPAPGGFRLDVATLRAVVGPRTRLILVNTPHNPTGAVLTRAELDAIAAVSREHDAIVVTDEVYEHLVFDDATHVPIATLPGMAGRTLTISSAGKTYSFTGWKVGWVHGPAELVTAVRTVKQFLTYTSGTPFQHAVAQALADDDAPRALAASLAARRDLLCEGLADAGFGVSVPQGTYFVVADAAPLGFPDGVELCRRLPELAGVVAVPVSAFCATGDDGTPSATASALASSVRFTFVKREGVLRDAVAGLRRLGAAGG